MIGVLLLSNTLHMARVCNPILFSKHFKKESSLLKEAGLIDPFLGIDTPLFIDPVLLEKSSSVIINTDAVNKFRLHFSNFIRLLRISQSEGDVAWRNAEKLLDLREPPENGLGYGGSGNSGSSRPEDIRLEIMRTSKEIIELGSNDPEMIALMGFFEEGVGPDTISDFTTRVILEQLAVLTKEFCEKHGIEVEENSIVPGIPLPFYLNKSGKKKYLVLVPEDIVRALPMANDWSELNEAIQQTNRVRAAVNNMLSSIARPTIEDRKEALRKAVLESPENFDEFLRAIKQYAVSYDPASDPLAYNKLKSIIAESFPDLGARKIYNFSRGPEEIKEMVLETIDLFKHHVENANLWEQLWDKDKPKKERAAQLIYYAIADAFCKANNIDISPEANMGGGPVDFKFSTGYQARVLVEMKRSDGTVEHGYKTQLEIYKDASQTNFGIFVVMNFGNLGKKLTRITQLRDMLLSTGEKASDIIVIDATKKASASKRM